MSEDLRRRVALHLFLGVIETIPFFSGIPDRFLGTLCLALETKIFLPFDCIIYRGEVGKEFYIIESGTAEVLLDCYAENIGTHDAHEPVVSSDEDLTNESKTKEDEATDPSAREGQEPVLLSAGAFFGEVALVMETRRQATVRAVTLCEILVLQRSVFDEMMQEVPDFASQIRELALTHHQISDGAAKLAASFLETLHLNSLSLDAAAHGSENIQENRHRKLKSTNVPKPSKNAKSSTVVSPADREDDETYNMDSYMENDVLSNAAKLHEQKRDDTVPVAPPTRGFVHRRTRVQRTDPTGIKTASLQRRIDASNKRKVRQVSCEEKGARSSRN